MSTSDIYWELTPLPNGKGYKGVIKIPLVGPLTGKSTVTATASSSRKDDAIYKAASIADQIASNPVIASLLPPGTPLAIEATKRIAGAAKAGKLDDAVRGIAGPAAKRLADALKSIF